MWVRREGWRIGAEILVAEKLEDSSIYSLTIGRIMVTPLLAELETRATESQKQNLETKSMRSKMKLRDAGHMKTL